MWQRESVLAIVLALCGTPGRAQPAPAADDGQSAARRRFLATVASAVGAISCLAIMAMWITVWVLSPCWQ